MTKDELKGEMKNKISMALKDPILQQGFEIICKDLADLEQQIATLAKCCNQLLKDKGDLTDKIADIKANCDFALEGKDVEIMELKAQIEKIRR